MKHLKLYEDWFDHLSDNPANIIDPEPNKQSKNEPFHYIFDNEYIIIIEMEGVKYVLDLLNLEESNPDLYKELAEDYIGVNQISGGMGKGHDMESDFESIDIHSLKDIDAEHIVSWLNDTYPNIEIGQSVDDLSNGEYYLTKINDDVKGDLLGVFKELKQII